MVEIGIARVPMHERLMPVLAIVGFTSRIVQPVRMLTVLVVRLPMLVLHRLVRMLIFMALTQRKS
jgi:hypothetical protein